MGDVGLYRPIALELDQLLFPWRDCQLNWWKWHVWLVWSLRLELICDYWPDLQFCYVCRDSLRLELFSDHWPDLQLCHMWDVGLFSQFVLELDHMLLLWRGCKLTWWEWHVWSASSMLLEPRWPDLQFCHMWDVYLFSQFVFELDHMWFSFEVMQAYMMRSLTRHTILPHVCRRSYSVCNGTIAYVVSLKGFQAYMMQVTCLISWLTEVRIMLRPLIKDFQLCQVRDEGLYSLALELDNHFRCLFSLIP